MKKIALFLLCIFTCMYKVEAQKFSVTPEIGYNIMNIVKPIHIADLKETDIRFGAGFDIALSNHFYLQTGYLIETDVKTINGNYVSTIGKEKLNSINVPVNFTFKTGKSNKTRFEFGIGTTINYITKAELTDYYNYKFTIAASTYSTPSFKICALMGVQIAKHICIKATYKLTYINDNDPLKNFYYDYAVIQKHALWITFGYKIGL